MNLFKQFNLIINASVNELIDRVEDPQTTIKQLVREMEHNLTQAKEQVVDAILHEQQLQEQLGNEQRSAEHWHNKAKTALQNNQENQAREALQRKQIHLQLIDTIEPTLTTAGETTQQLKAQLLQLENKLKEVKIKQNALLARDNALSAQQKMGISQQQKTDSVNRRLDKLEDEMFEREARLAAMQALELELNPVENAILDLKQNRAIDDELALLKLSLDADK